MYLQDYFLTHTPRIGDNELLRTPQKIAYERVFRHFALEQKRTHAIVSLPTGVGKTGLMGLLPYGLSNGRVLIITPQLVIKDHVTDSLDPDFPGNFWLKHNVFDSVKQLPILVEYDRTISNEALNLANIIVVNIQKLQSRLMNSLMHRVPQNHFDMIIVDEAHHSTAATWVAALDYFHNAKVVKLTGTPYRTDGQPIMGELVYQYRLSAAMANGYVKSLENFTYVPGDLLLTIDGKEYSLEEIYELGLRDRDWVSRSVAFSEDCSRRVVEHSVEILRRKLTQSRLPLKIIAVACSIEHAHQIKALYEEVGVRTAIVHSDLPRDEKERALSYVENHRVQAVINVSMLGEGYDHKYLAVGAIFRPFRSQLPYEQFIGRLLRVIPEEEQPGTEDNIADIVSHQCLYLEELWEYYKRELQEAEIIKELEELDLDVEPEPNVEQALSEGIELGVAIEKGLGSVISDPYLSTELIRRRREEEAEDARKIDELQRLLNISGEEARSVLRQTKARSRLRRPDLFEKFQREEVDRRIKQDMVPRLLADFGIPKESRSLVRSRLFEGTRMGWIAKMEKRDNAALLSIYINNALKERMGAKRDEWQTSDWDIAMQRLDEIEEYIVMVLKEFTGSESN